jgi:hypothetical protein
MEVSPEESTGDSRMMMKEVNQRAEEETSHGEEESR